MPSSETATAPPADVASTRALLLDGLVTVAAFAAAVGVTERTVSSWITQGLPAVWIARRPHPKRDEAIAWVRTRRTRQAAPLPPPRGPGRPRKAGEKK